MKKKVYTTSWLDFITYIAIPIVLLLGLINVVKTMFSMSFTFYTISMMLIEIVFLIFYGVTAYYTHKRYHKAYNLLLLFFWVTAIRAAFDFANTQTVNTGDNFFLEFALYLGICYLAWILPNKSYLAKRKEIFREEIPTASKEKDVDTIKEKENLPKESKEEVDSVEEKEESSNDAKEEDVDTKEEMSEPVEEEKEIPKAEEESSEKEEESLEKKEEETKEEISPDEVEDSKEEEKKVD